MLTDGYGVPLSIVVSGANTHDVKLLAETLDGIVVERPPATDTEPQHLCADAAYVGEQVEEEITARRYTPHVRPRGEEIDEKQKNPAYTPRRWVVEVCHSWFNRFRKILVRYEKTDRSYLGLLMLAAAIITFRKVNAPGKPNVIYG